jgi:hypothetical protein
MRPTLLTEPEKITFLPKPQKVALIEDPLKNEFQLNSLANIQLATIIIESAGDNQYNTEQRLQTLKTIVTSLITQHLENGIIVFPARMFYTHDKPPSSIYPQIESAVASYLASTGKKIIICFGIDGSLDPEEYARDQIAVAIDRSGIVALGRKFYPAKAERGHVNLAENFNAPEEGKSRIFKFGNASYYLAMCYDSFGIKNQNIKNPGVNAILEFVHCFYPKGQGPSGEAYFARHGFAGASRQWACPVFGTAVFFNRKVPERWPTGVIWNQGSMSTTHWNYDLNPLKPVNIINQKIAEGNAVIRLFSLT